MSFWFRSPASLPAFTVPDEAAAVAAFWFDAGPDAWFAKDPAFDECFRDRFLACHDGAARGELAAWLGSPIGALGLVLLLDQFPRNAFRGMPRMYATDEAAREITARAIELGCDQAVRPELRLFFYLPFAHSESLEDQDRSVALVAGLGQPYLGKAERHRSIIVRFGRFPHRNPILRRTTTEEEQRYLDEGGYAG